MPAGKWGEVRIGVAVARFNDAITVRLLAGARAALRHAGVDDANVCEVWVPGSFELPLAAKALVIEGHCDAVIALGAVIRGETSHYDIVSTECASGLQRVQLDTGTPVVFGVLTTENLLQAIERASVNRMNLGGEAATTALAMIRVLRDVDAFAKDRPR